MHTLTNGQRNKGIAAIAASALAIIVGGGLLTPGIASAQTSKEKSRQNNKNLMRNLTIGLGAAAVYEGLKGHNTNALVLGAGAAVTGTQYEKERKSQSRDNDRYGYGNYGDYRNDGSYRNNGDYRNNDDYRNNGDYRSGTWDQNRRPDYNDARYKDEQRRRREQEELRRRRDQDNRWDRNNNGNHRGW